MNRSGTPQLAAVQKLTDGSIGPGTRYRLRFRAQLQPHGALRLIAPVARRVLRRRWERDLTTIRSVLEGRGADLAMRPVRSVNGSKSRWAMIIAVNFVGPIAHFRWGRRPT